MDKLAINQNIKGVFGRSKPLDYGFQLAQKKLSCLITRKRGKNCEFKLLYNPSFSINTRASNYNYINSF